MVFDKDPPHPLTCERCRSNPSEKDSDFCHDCKAWMQGKDVTDPVKVRVLDYHWPAGCFHSYGDYE